MVVSSNVMLPSTPVVGAIDHRSIYEAIARFSLWTLTLIT